MPLDRDQLLGHWCARSAIVLKANVEARLAPWGLSAPAAGILMHAADLGRTSLVELARAVQHSHPSVLRQLDELERMGLVVRRPNPEDRRVKIIEVTAPARAILPEIELAVASAHRHIAEQLDPEDLQCTLRTLRQIALRLGERETALPLAAPPAPGADEPATPREDERLAGSRSREDRE